MWGRVTVPIGISQSLDTIFSALLVGGINKALNANLYATKVEIFRGCYSRFISNFPNNIFNDNYAIFYEIMVTLQTKIFTVEQLESIIESNRDLILDSPYINKAHYSQTTNGNIASDDDIVRAVTANLIDKLVQLSNTVTSEEEFKSSCITYVAWYKATVGEFTAINMAAIMSDFGYEEKKPGKRSRRYKGIDDMMLYYNEKMQTIKSLSDTGKVNSTVLDEKWFESEMSTETKKDMKQLFSIGIKEMDATIGELRRGNMLGVLGPPKGGKTRFTNYLVSRALQLGYNVCVWPLEGEMDEWVAMQVASLIASISYNEAKSGKKESMIRLSSKDVLNKTYTSSPEIRKQVAAAKKIMSSGENYGRLSFIQGTAYVEDMFDVLEAHFENENPFDVLVIDQLVNVMSKTGKGKTERISEAYMKMKDFLANKLKVPALGIMPAQLKQDVVDYLRSHPDETIDVTAGGESAETIRTPDETIGLFSSKAERDNNIMKFYSVASRHNGSFDDFQAKCYLECCFFMSQDEEIK